MGEPNIRVFDSPVAASEAALTTLEHTLASRPRALVSFATGKTYATFFAELTERVQAGRIAFDQVRATHLDEYLGFTPGQRGGMVTELTTACPPLGELLADGRFLPVPSSGDPEEISAYEARIEKAGGIDLVYLGIGRNGHIGFNEPGTSPDSSVHRTRLAETTRRDAQDRFPAEPPREAVTAGLQTILAARQVVLVATGEAKAPAVRAMLRGEISPACPASYLRKHRNALVLLDRAAAVGLDATGSAEDVAIR